MKEKVYINIKGLQLAAQNVPRDYEEDEDDPVEVINVGRYRIINGKEYIKYDEVLEGTTKKCTSTIKIAGNSVEVTKKGPVTAHLSFVPGEKTMTCSQLSDGFCIIAACIRLSVTDGITCNVQVGAAPLSCCCSSDNRRT